MIDYATFQRIQHLHRVEQLTVTQIAHAIALDARTVRRWLDEPRFRSLAGGARPSPWFQALSSVQSAALLREGESSSSLPRSPDSRSWLPSYDAPLPS